MQNEKGRKFYIAYGSNLSLWQMEQRVPDAKLVGTAELLGWQLRFRKYATIVENPAYRTPVLVWDISEQDEQTLDKYEGFPRSYVKRDFEVAVKPIWGGSQRQLTAMAYIMTDIARDRILPTDQYYNIIQRGYQNLGFEMEILRQALADSLSDEKRRATRQKFAAKR